MIENRTSCRETALKKKDSRSENEHSELEKERSEPGMECPSFHPKDYFEENQLREAAFVYGTSAEQSFEGAAISLPELPQKKQGEYTLEDYHALPEERRVELIDGVIYDMAAPTTVHQAVIGSLFVQFFAFLKHNKGRCKVLLSPVDVQLDRDNRTMVQPDIVVICDPEKIDRHCYGAPDLIVEVLSPSTSRKDRILKLRKYAGAGVQEYWLIDPEDLSVLLSSALPDVQTFSCYTFQDQIPVGIWQGKCIIDFAEIYEEIRDLL